MASSSSSSASAQAFSSRSWKHHVFLSFRGEDTRKIFVGHLYDALKRMGIETYKDDKKLSLGEEINPSLIEAIEQSQIAIVVFSENYADSTWCLNELRHIMECREKRGLIVVPIFYGVEPSDVRKQKRKYEEAFSKHKLENEANVQSWRKALEEASGNCGQDFKNAKMDDAELIKKIVNEISKKIRPLTPRVNDKLVGMEARMDALISKLQIGSDCVLMVGIWGVGGGGKTTLATSVYSRISWDFDGCCCIENIREQSSKNGLAKLQGEVISGVLKQDKVNVYNIEEGKDMIRDRFSGKKVLIVLDDVDQREQLEALAGSVDWFAKGSRIIITTRDEHLLKAHKVVVHDISLLGNDEATKLLRKCAGLDDKPMEDYKQLLKEVVSYASGLPLALTVLGSFLCKRDINQWKSTLAKLKKIPDKDIVGKLRISYDGLDKVYQDLFLDIACFFRGEIKDSAWPILDACGLCPDIGLEVLREKALITISDDEYLDMHDLVQEMGHHIVRGEHPHNPEKHSRIWKKEDVQTICALDAKTDLDMIEALRYKYGGISSKSDPLQHLPPIVANTKNLRWIDWEGDLANPLLTNFPQRNLCCLILRNNMQKQLWKGYKHFPYLKMMKLWKLPNLIVTPEFKGLLNLESFTLCEASNLKEIHSSFGLLEKLVFLSIELCPEIKIFPPLNQLKNLETLSFRGSPGLFQLSEIQQIHHTGFYHAGLTKLDLSRCKLRDEDIGSSEWELPHLQQLILTSNKFSRLDFSTWRLPQLKWLNVNFCSALVELSNLPSSIAVVDAKHCSSLERLGDTSNCKWLWKVSSRRAYKLDPFDGERLLKSMLQGNAIEPCPEIKIFPPLNQLKNLETLSFRGSCGLFQLSEIQQIHHTGYHAGLTKLNLGDCKLRDEDIGSSEWELPHLQELNLSDNEFSRLDFSRWRLPQLKWLNVGWCSALVELSNLPSSIAIVDAEWCRSLERFGDTSNCKWLWKVSNREGYKLDPFDGERLLKSMLQGNAIEDYFIRVVLENQIPKGFVGSFFKGKTFTLRAPLVSKTSTLHLPNDWYNDFSGFLIRVVTGSSLCMVVDIIIKHEHDSEFKIWQEYDEAPEPKYNGEVRTFVGYISFGSLRQTTSLNSSYNTISFSIMKSLSSFTAELVPMKSKNDALQTTNVSTNCSEFWNEGDFKCFWIMDDSKSNIRIRWITF